MNMKDILALFIIKCLLMSKRLLGIAAILLKTLK